MGIIIAYKNTWDIALNTEQNNMAAYRKNNGERLGISWLCYNIFVALKHLDGIKTSSSQGKKVLNFNFVTFLAKLVEHDQNSSP